MRVCGTLLFVTVSHEKRVRLSTVLGCCPPYSDFPATCSAHERLTAVWAQKSKTLEPGLVAGGLHCIPNHSGFHIYGAGIAMPSVHDERYRHPVITAEGYMSDTHVPLRAPLCGWISVACGWPFSLPRPPFSLALPSVRTLQQKKKKKPWTTAFSEFIHCVQKMRIK